MSKASGGSNHGRVRARRCAVQALYQWQMAGQEPRDIVKEFVSDRELVSVDMEYFTSLVSEVPRHFETLKTDLTPFLDREWLQLDPVARSVLLLGAYEMRYCLEIPYRVVINEGVELCKMFGTVEGHRYVNGVLDRLAHTARSVEVRATQPP
ncbi:MAG: transcription antitermination factor NusB [Gammaproteobacteria bacterium]|nr:transcription antitermination factor NusB [Gammaproteobacteria bacterium]